MKAKACPIQDGRFTFREAGKPEQKRFDKLLEEKHPQQKPKRVGHELRMIVDEAGEWVGILIWTSGCQRLQDRDEWIGWTNAQRAQRLKLVVQLRRYLLLHEAGTRPNLASEILAAAVRHLPVMWRNRCGFEPLLAESFSDIEAHAGTCYKAAGWTAAGMSKGYAKHRGDLYSFHGRPKKLWLRPLHKEAVGWLCSPRLPERYEVGATASAHGQMPLRAEQIPASSQRQPARHQSALDPANRRLPLFDVTQKGHGRLETWRISLATGEPMEVNFPHARCAISIHHFGTRNRLPFDE